MIKVNVTPKELACRFWGMVSEDQALFFNELGVIARDLSSQLEAVSRDDGLTSLAPAGRRVMEQIGEYSQRTESPLIKVNTKGENTFCPECGFGVGVDEDGCCSCGTPATGSAVDELFRDAELVKDAVQNYYMISHHALEYYEKGEDRDRVICIIDDLASFAKRFDFELE